MRKQHSPEPSDSARHVPVASAGRPLLAALLLWAAHGCADLDNKAPLAPGARPEALSSLASTPLASAPSCDDASCCPQGTSVQVLSEGPDVVSNTTAKTCLVARAGSDTIAAHGAGSSVLAGPGDDTVMAGPAASVRAGAGNDTVNAYAGGTVLGGAGDDTIAAANGKAFVVPGPGLDTVRTGTGDDTVAIYDLCEVVAGESLIGGPGKDTLVTPVPLAQLTQLGVSVREFENVLLDTQASCHAECFDRDACAPGGHCTFAWSAADGLASLSSPPPEQSASYRWFVRPPAFFAPRAPASGLLPPGAYTDLTVQAGKTVTLQAGTYFVRKLAVNPTGSLRSDGSGGQVLVYVLDALDVRGAIAAKTGSASQLTLAYAGNADLTLSASFQGTLFAPAASVTLAGPATYVGAFLARSLSQAPGASVSLTAPLLPPEASEDRSTCIAHVERDKCLPEAERDARYQRDILQYCIAPGLGGCEAQLQSAVNHDRHAAALSYVAKRFDSSDYLGLVRDRTRKQGRARADSQLMAAYCSGDADGDLIPDRDDRCPATPALTSTDDSGCTVTARPEAPSGVVVDYLLERQGFLSDGKCKGAPPPSEPTPLHASCWGNGSKQLYLARVENQPEGCGVFYELRVYVPGAEEGPRTLAFAYKDSDAWEGPLLGPGGGDFGAAAHEILFRADNGGPGDQAVWGWRVWPRMVVSARATNGNGQQSGWSTPLVLDGMACLQ